ncbi:MAG: hypothetical protein ACREEM_56425, partial [Blastocatellia bacterium]
MQDDSLPQGLEFVSVQQTVGAGFTCTNPGVGSNGVVSCTKGVMAAGRTGWMKFWSNNEYGLFGATINLNSNAAANTGSFNQGH